MFKPLFSHVTTNISGSRARSLAVFASLLFFYLSFAHPDAAFAQNIKYTKGNTDSALQSGLEVDPSTLGMSVQVPLTSYPGRGGGMPVMLQYSSKQWRVEFMDTFQTTINKTRTEALFPTPIIAGRMAGPAIRKVTYPTGGYGRFAYGTVPGLSGSLDSFVYNQANRGVTDRWVSVKGDGTDEASQHSTYSVDTTGPYLVRATSPDGTKTERLLHRTASDQYFGFDDARSGRAYEERVFSSSGQMIRRTLTEWTTSGPTPAPPIGVHSATRNPRATKMVEILLDTGDINSMPLGTLLRTDAATFFVNDTTIPQTTRDAYRALNLLSLPTEKLVKNSAGTVVAATKFSYDEAAYAPLTYTTVTGWTNPNTTYRGNMTTTQGWQNFDGTNFLTYPNGSFIVTHAQPDQCGNVRKIWDANGKVTETFHADSFSDSINRNTYAFATSGTTPIPDTSGYYSASVPFILRSC